MHDAGAKEGLVVRSENGVGAPIVYVLHDGCDLGVLLADPRDEGFAAGELLAVGDEREEHVFGGESLSHDGMAQYAATAVLVVGGNVQVVCNMRDVVEDAAYAVGLYETLLAVHEPMRAALVEAAPHAFAWSVGGRRFVAISERLLHAPYGLQGSSVLLDYFGEELCHGVLLALELQLVRHCQQLTAAAALRNGACVRLVSHGSSVAEMSIPCVRLLLAVCCDYVSPGASLVGISFGEESFIESSFHEGASAGILFDEAISVDISFAEDESVVIPFDEARETK